VELGSKSPLYSLGAQIFEKRDAQTVSITRLTLAILAKWPGGEIQTLVGQGFC
jgi:hypothetical protein